MVLGTIGSAHAKNPQYSWPHLDSILLRSSPELLLVQIRPDHFEKNELFDGSPEMAYLAYLARNTGIECRGIDWWLNVQLAQWDLIRPSERISNIYKNILSELQTTKAQMIMIAVDTSLVLPLRDRLIIDNYKEWSCPQAQFTVSNYPDLPKEITDIFREGIMYLSTMPSVNAVPVQKKIKDLGDIVRGKGYLFKR